MPTEQKRRNVAAAARLYGCNVPGDLRTADGRPSNDRVQRGKARHSLASLEAIDGVFAAGRKIIIAGSGSSGHASLMGDARRAGMPDGRRGCGRVPLSLDSCRQRPDCVRLRTITRDCRDVYRSARSVKRRRSDHGLLECPDERPPVFVIATRDSASPDSMLRYQKALSVLRCANGRGRRASVPAASEPLPEIVRFKPLAYDWAALNGCPVGHPRNLAKTALNE
jgi:hypothetical protein